MATYSIQEFIEENGNCPVHKWLSSLDKTIKARILARIKRFEDGNFGDVKNLGGSLFEARLFFGPGYRLYYSVIDGKIILLLFGGDKDNQNRDIQKAAQYLKDFMEVTNAYSKS